MKCYLYHRVPKGLTGNTLYPLNELKNKFPDLYEMQVKKYKGREFVKKLQIPFLNCLWNDVLHLGAVNPKEIYEEIRKYEKNIPRTKFYKISADILDPKDTTVFLCKDYEDKMSSENFSKYVPEDVCKYSEFPQATKDYYKETYKGGNLPLLWHRVLHILYKGVLNLSDLEIIEV